MYKLLRIANILDEYGQFRLSDKLFKIARNDGKIILADQGVYIPYGPDGVNLLDMISKFTNDSVEMLYGKKTINLTKLDSLIKSSYLANFINKVELEPDGTGFYGTYNRPTKTMTINANFTQRDLENIVGTIGHETVHSVKPLDEAEQRSKIKAGRKQYELLDAYKKLEDEKNVEWQKIIDKFQNGIIDRNQRLKEFRDLEAKYSKKFKNLEKQYSYKPFYASGVDRGRIPYFFNEEILAQTIDIKRSFNVNVLNEVYKRYYLPYNIDAKKFVSDLRSLIAEFDKIQKTVDMMENDPQLSASLQPENLLKKLDNKLYPDVEIKYQQGDQKTIELAQRLIEEQQKKILINNVPQYRILKNIENMSGQQFIWKLMNIKDPVYFEHIKKSLSNDLLTLEQNLGLKEVHQPLRSETPQPKKQNVKVDDSSAVSQQTSQQKSLQKASSNSISQQTSKIVGNKLSTPQSKNALSAALPTISKLFKQLNKFIIENLDKLNNSKAGKVFNYGMLAKDVYFIVTLADRITKQIEAGEEIMMKDQLDLGLTIVSTITDQQTQAILRAIFPPIIVLLNNPQIQAWLVGINVGANLLSGAVSVTDYLGSLSGTTNKSEGAISGVLNTPGSLQALVMPVFQLREKYGEVYNALIDIEKGIPQPQAIAKHIMKDSSGGLEPYRLSLLYKFTENKAKIIAYQNSPAFKKLPTQNQLLYPNANSTYAVSSYKKARDAQERAKQEAYNRNFGPGSGGLSRNVQ